MYGDFSRVTYDPAKQYSAVLYQQGRVRLDAEDNEQQAIQAAAARTAMIDLVGPGAGPAGDLGFEINRSDTTLTIGKGSYYVDGIRVVNPADTTYAAQPYLAGNNVDLPEVPFLVYLRVWERLVTAVSDPALREVALGDLAPDTAARSQVIWQVLITTELNDQPISAITDIGSTFDEFRTAPNPARLIATAKQDTPDTTPCVLSPDSEYRGPENQLYRVEVHDGSEPLFKWSRDNGSVVFPVTDVAGAVVTVTTLGRDGKTALEVGDLVELVDDNYGLDISNTPRQLVNVTAVDTVNLTVTLEESPSGVVGPHPMLRRWDGKAAISGDLQTLEDGIQVQFSLVGTGNYRNGDYWLIPARVATGDVQWPRDPTGKPIAQPPAGVINHYAPLAVVRPGVSLPDELRDVFPVVSFPYKRPTTGNANPKPTTPEPTAVEHNQTEATADPAQPTAGTPRGNPTATNRLDQPATLVYPGPAPAAA